MKTNKQNKTKKKSNRKATEGYWNKSKFELDWLRPDYEVRLRAKKHKKEKVNDVDDDDDEDRNYDDDDDDNEDNNDGCPWSDQAKVVRCTNQSQRGGVKLVFYFYFIIKKKKES